MFLFCFCFSSCVVVRFFCDNIILCVDETFETSLPAFVMVGFFPQVIQLDYFTDGLGFYGFGNQVELFAVEGHGGFKEGQFYWGPLFDC
jgi:hypothetical protein